MRTDSFNVDIDNRHEIACVDCPQCRGTFLETEVINPIIELINGIEHVEFVCIDCFNGLDEICEQCDKRCSEVHEKSSFNRDEPPMSVCISCFGDHSDDFDIDDTDLSDGYVVVYDEPDDYDDEDNYIAF